MEIRKFLFFFTISPLLLFGNDAWESTQLIWNFGLISSCDVGFPQNPRDYFKAEPSFASEQYENVKDGDILWVPPRLLKEFYEKALPHIQSTFVLVVSDGDATFPTDCLYPDQFQELLANEKILHIFAQNCDYQGTSKKISPIPIGIDFHTVAYKGYSGGWGMIGSPQQQERYLTEYLEKAPPTSKKNAKSLCGLSTL